MNRRRLSGYTPADLQNMGFLLDAVRFFEDDPEDVATDSTPSPTLTDSEVRRTACRVEASERSRIPVEPLSSEPTLNDRKLNACPPAVKPLRPLCGAVASEFRGVGIKSRYRSKVSKLPEDIRNNLNALLRSGNSYSQIVRWLNAQGYTGFNKVNLHNWRVGGFQHWLQSPLTVGQPSFPGVHSLGEAEARPGK